MRLKTIAAAILATATLSSISVSYAATVAGSSTVIPTLPVYKIDGPTSVPKGQIAHLVFQNPDGSPYQARNDVLTQVVITPLGGNGLAKRLLDSIPPSIDIESPNGVSYVVEIKAAYASAGGTPLFKTVTSKLVQFPAPSIMASRLTAYVGTGQVTSADVGYQTTFRAMSFPSWDTKKFPNVTMTGYWTLPNGEAVKGLEANYTPTEADYLAKSITVKYTAMVDGLPATQKTTELKLPVSRYVWPDFKITSTQDFKQAPISATLRVEPKTFDDQKAMSGKVISYRWLPPAQSTISFTSIRNTATAQIYSGPMAYPVSVEVTDQRGNKRTISTEIVAGEPGPISTEMNLLPVGKYIRAPMEFMIQPKFVMSHPRDRIAKYELYLNNNLIYTSEETTSAGMGGRVNIVPALSPKSVKINAAGDALVTLKVYSAYGAYGAVERRVTVAENKLPSCTALDVTLARDKKSVSARSSGCVDSDGFIKTYTWFVDDVQVKTAFGNSMVYLLPPGTVPHSVRLQLTDDVGGVTNVEKNVPQY